MRVIVIGGCGHIGSYLVPRLVSSGYEVVVVSRGMRQPYVQSGLWRDVERVTLDREAGERDGTFGKSISGLGGDIIVDLISFTLDSTVHLAQAVQGKVAQYLFCGSIWAHGAATVLPATEDLPRHPFGEYGIQKNACEQYLLAEAKYGRLPATVVMPGHITGPGWECINPSGNFDPMVFQKLAAGEEILIPHFGMETVHHVHADDVAQVFHRAILSGAAAVGESFHAVATSAMTLRGFAEGVAAWFGREANIRYLPWEEWKAAVARPDYIESTYNHIAHSDNYSWEKARRLLGYTPRYSILEAVRECVDSMIGRGVIQVPCAGDNASCTHPG